MPRVGTGWLIPVGLAIVAFAVTCGIAFWPQKPAAPASPPVAHNWHSAAVPAPSIAAVASDAPQPQTTVAKPQKRVLFDPATLADPDPTTAEPAPPEPPLVPAIFQTEANADGTYTRATLQNTSGEPLNISISISNANTGATSAISVMAPPHRRKNLSELGLTVAPGDQVRLQAAGYREQVVAVN
jgi:hypothetical protein